MNGREQSKKDERVGQFIAQYTRTRWAIYCPAYRMTDEDLSILLILFRAAGRQGHNIKRKKESAR